MKICSTVEISFRYGKALRHTNCLKTTDIALPLFLMLLYAKDLWRNIHAFQHGICQIICTIFHEFSLSSLVSTALLFAYFHFVPEQTSRLFTYSTKHLNPALLQYTLKNFRINSPGTRGVTSTYTGTGCAIFQGAFFR